MNSDNQPLLGELDKAQERGRARDLDVTVAELLVELGG